MKSRKSIFYTLSLVFCLIAYVSAQTSISGFPQAVINLMASREERYHHYLWHSMRDNWNRYTDAVKKQFRDLGWEPPRPARRYDSAGLSYAITDNNSGEDFLYMHKQMIAKVKKLVGNNSRALAFLSSWKTLPAPGDKDYPVPANYVIPQSPSTTSSTNTRKTVDFYNRNIKPYETTFKDPVQLRKMTLGELGSRLEVTVHNYLHMRFSSSCPVGYRTSYRGTIPYIDPMWDVPAYNWLGDTYSSHVHPVFWKIHGWVDDRIEDWRKANGISTIRWKGTWTGGPMSTLSSVLIPRTTTTSTKSLRTPTATLARGSKEVAQPTVLDQVMQLALENGDEISFADDVRFVDFVPEANKYKASKSTSTSKSVSVSVNKSK